MNTGSSLREKGEQVMKRTRERKRNPTVLINSEYQNMEHREKTWKVCYTHQEESQNIPQNKL